MGLYKTDNVNCFTGNINDTSGVTVKVVNTAALPIDVSDKQVKSIQFAGTVSSGNGLFAVEISNDGTNWVVYNRLIPNVIGTNSQTDAYQAAPNISATGSSIFFFPVSDYFRYLRVSADISGAGTYYATLQAAG
jgi:hypothetical protein